MARTKVRVVIRTVPAVLLVMSTACSGPVKDDDTLPNNSDIETRSDALRAPVALSAAEEDEIDEYIGNLVEPSTIIETIAFGDDLFDCVPVLEQPSIREMRAQGVRIDRLDWPSDESQQGESVEEAAPSNGTADSNGQVAYESKTLAPDCPEGAVTIRRVKKEEIAEWGSLEKYLNRPPPSSSNYEYARFEYNSDNRGGVGDFNLWNPFVGSGSHSIAQLWVFADGFVFGDPSFETIEVGWIKVVGQNAKLFVYTTPDGYDTSCWNTTCGFVAYANTGITLDAPFASYSVIGGAQAQATFDVHKNSSTSNWYFYYGSTLVGYWPKSFYSGTLKTKAEGFYIGGEVYGDNSGTHTSTDMGSGHWPPEGWQQAAYIKKVKYRSTSNVMTDMPVAEVAHATDSQCYDGVDFNLSGDANWKRGLYYGGSGFNTSCP